MEVSKPLIKFGLFALGAGVLALGALMIKSGIKVRIWHSLIGFATSLGCFFVLETQHPESPYDLVLLAASALIGLLSVAVLFAARRISAESGPDGR